MVLRFSICRDQIALFAGRNDKYESGYIKSKNIIQNMKKKIMIATSVALIACGAFVGVKKSVANKSGDLLMANVEALASEAGDSDCTLCKVTYLGATLFSCKPKIGSSCSATKKGATVSCSNAIEC